MNSCSNQTVGGEGPGGTEDAQRVYENLSQVINKVLMPGICVFGMVGNILNLTILTRRKLQKSFRTLEQAANLCLISLAVSDLMFCVFVFPHMFLPSDDIYDDRGWLLSYKLYCTAIINIFIMESTLLTVAMSLERYLACCFPLRQDLYLTTRRIKFVIVFTVIFSLSFNIPVFWRYEVVVLCARNVSEMSYHFPSTAAAIAANVTSPLDSLKYAAGSWAPSTDSSVLLSTLKGLSSGHHALTPFPPNKAAASAGNWTMPGQSSSASSSENLTSLLTLLSNESFQHQTFNFTPVKYTTLQVLLLDSQLVDTVYRILWACFGNVLPLILLFYFNVCLCRKIYKSYKMRRQFKRPAQAKSSSHTLTITLVVIVVMFFILVAPTEIVMHVSQITSHQSSPESRAIEMVLNLMQAINFSVNFILYCIISPYFRKTLKYMMLCGCYNIYQVSRQWKKEFETSLM